MSRKQPLVRVLIAAAASSGCASIMHGTRQDVSIASTPSGASVTINGQDRGKTPAAVELSRKDKHLLKVELPGYLPFESYLIRKVSGWVWGNLVFGGIPGLAIDAITGGLYNLNPEDVTVTLTPSPAALTVQPANSRAPPIQAPPAPDQPQLATAVPTVQGPASEAPNLTPSALALAGRRVRIVTEPAGAHILVGSIRVGSTATNGLVLELPEGQTVCRIEATGYEPVERTFTVPHDDEGQSAAPIVVVIRLVAQKR